MATELTPQERAVAWQIGYGDGYVAAEDSGTADAPVDGWDGWTINAIGREAMCELLQEPPEESRNGWSPRMLAKLGAYSEGAQFGADRCITGYER